MKSQRLMRSIPDLIQGEKRFTPLGRVTHFLMKRLPKVATEMALHVLAYNLTRVINIIGVTPLLMAMKT